MHNFYRISFQHVHWHGRRGTSNRFWIRDIYLIGGGKNTNSKPTAKTTGPKIAKVSFHTQPFNAVACWMILFGVLQSSRSNSDTGTWISSSPSSSTNNWTDAKESSNPSSNRSISRFFLLHLFLLFLLRLIKFVLPFSFSPLLYKLICHYSLAKKVYLKILKKSGS